MNSTSKLFCPMLRNSFASNVRQSFALANKLFVEQRRNVHHHKEWNIDKNLYMGITRSNPHRANRNTHINEKRFRKLRGKKTLEVELPDDVEVREQQKMTPDQLRISLLKKGINPYKEVTPREWTEHQLTLQSFHAVLDPYVRSEVPNSLITMEGLTAKGIDVKDRVKNRFYNWYQGVRRIKKKAGLESFDIKKFGAIADHVYVAAYNALIERDKTLLHDYITEHAFVKLWPDVESGSVFWELVDFVEPSKVVSVRCTDHPNKSGNDIAQITVKMHTTQKLAIYDRFGHLLLGSEIEPKECIEYVVFENHIASSQGKWRFHDKIYPHWLKPKQSILRPELLDPERQSVSPTELKLGYGKKSKDKEVKKE